MKDFVKQIWEMIIQSNLLSILGAIAILLIGWLLAMLASRKTAVMIHNLTSKKNKLPDGSEIPMNHADTLASKVVYYVIMIFAVLGCFSVLHLNAAAAPIQEFITTISRYAPNIVGALMLVVVAWIVAGIVRAAVKTFVLKSKMSERLAAQNNQEPTTVATYTANTMFYVVLLFFLPAILNVLKIYGITQPLQSMFEKLLSFVPNVFAALAILAVGLWGASIIRKAVSGLIVITRLNAFGEKAGVSRIFGNGGLASMAGLVAYVLVAIPVVISALTALQIEALSNTVATFFNKLLNATGDIIGASLVIFIAILAASFAATLVTDLVAAFGFDKLIAAMGFKSEKENSVAPSVIVGKITFISIILMSLLAACEILGFNGIADLIKTFASFGGNILLSVVVLLVGIWLANFAADAIKGKCNELIVTGVRVMVILFTIALAISNMKIGDSIVQIAFTLIIGAVCVAAAIAFGVGGRDFAAQLLKEWSEKLKK